MLRRDFLKTIAVTGTFAGDLGFGGAKSDAGILYEAGPVVSPAGLRAVRVDFARFRLSFDHHRVGRGDWPRRRPPLIALAVRIVDAEIVLGVLVQIFRRNAVVTDHGFPRKSDVTLENLVGAAADLDVGAVAVERLIVL
jgi:hypothetical protein